MLLVHFYKQRHPRVRCNWGRSHPKSYTRWFYYASAGLPGLGELPSKSDLEKNKITGVIPHDLNTLKELQTLDFSSNDITGKIPPLDNLAQLNDLNYKEFGDPEIQTRVQQYEMAFRMQTAVPELTDLSKEPDNIIKMYGADCLVPGTYAANCLLARKLSEAGVRFVQLYHQGWDQHGNMTGEMPLQAQDVDRATAALIMDLKQRGLLDETLVIWGGEFGRTNYCQGKFSAENYGRDHHPRTYTIWMAGGGVKPGITYGESDEFGYNIVRDPVHVNDFHATILHLMGLNHEQLTYKHLGRRYRLTDVAGKVVPGILA